MESLHEQILHLLNDAVTDIKANLANQGVNASGRTSDSLRVVDNGDSMQIIIGGTSERTAPLATLEVGRGGGNVPKGIKAILVQWTKDKGIQVESESHRWAIATIIARNIAERGTQRQSSPIDVYSGVITDLRKKVAETFQGFVNQEITNKIHSL